ncbi:KDGP aldolase [Paenibacillus larvae]|uniref:Uncharacterized protein n=1 Tax=Paenibacillus larvae subsp. larvae TaxID=147375 RepID=A0A6C0QPC7_9BACL|nr:KDGP aldolase [Paenibacillus larvae]QHZ50579.1 hypothetical protein ERICV_01418 [Paenibacillus larvae subsp. larvae]
MEKESIKIQLNVLAKDIENAKEIVEQTQGNVFIGMMVKNYSSSEEAVHHIKSMQEAGVPVSVGLGAGDPAQWKRVAEVAVQTKPVHVNQAFPAAGYTLGALRQAGSSHTLVNALIRPAGVPGKVWIGTGPISKSFEEMVSCEAAAAMLAEIGVHSVKFYPVEGIKRLDEIAGMVRAAVKHGIQVFEPTGGIDTKTIAAVVKVCAENGARHIIPHIYTAIVDKETGRTRLEDIRALQNAVKEVLG